MSFSRPLEVDGVTFNQTEVDVIEIFGEVQGFAELGAKIRGCVVRSRTLTGPGTHVERYAEKRKTRMCNFCNAEPARDKHVNCASCADKAKSFAKTTYDSRKAAGLCTKCGVASNGKSRCPTCMSKKRKKVA